ncbi:MAG: hypothetical protein KDA75_14435 [Planctomycetaceae bacterium]|nr:hypothetical protein [Planctomycetaceae bacterium]
MDDQSTSIAQHVRVMQIIAGALVMGAVAFALISTLVLGSLSAQPEGQIISLIGIGWAAVSVVAHFVVPDVIAQAALKSRPESDAASLCGVYLTKTIVAMALLEGAAFLNLVALTVEHNWWSLAVAGGLVFLMLVQMPTLTRVQQWIEIQQMNSE